MCSVCHEEALQYEEYTKLFGATPPRDTTPETGTVKHNDDPDVLLRSAKIAVIHAFNKTDASDTVELTEKDVYIVWFSKTLQNWKALLSTDLHDNRYYEVTFNGNTGEVYVDIYQKLTNTLLFDTDIKRDL